MLNTRISFFAEYLAAIFGAEYSYSAEGQKYCLNETLPYWICEVYLWCKKCIQIL